MSPYAIEGGFIALIVVVCIAGGRLSLHLLAIRDELQKLNDWVRQPTGRRRE